MARKQLGAAPSNAADTATKAYVDTAVGNASVSWDTITGKPTYVGAGATQADARAAIGAASTADLTPLSIDGGTPSDTSSDSIDGGTP